MVSNVKQTKAKLKAGAAATALQSKLDRALGYILAGGGVLGLIAAFVLTIDKITLIKDPSFQPSCNINPIISCGSVMATNQSEAFGFPNSIIGLIGFTAVAVTGFALLAGARFKHWYWLALQAGLLFAVAFVHWLIFQTIYRINALCPYCMVVWISVIPMFWYLTLYNLRNGHIKVSERLKPVSNFIEKHHGDILLVWFLGILGLILEHFWYYWKTLL